MDNDLTEELLSLAVEIARSEMETFACLRARSHSIARKSDTSLDGVVHTLTEVRHKIRDNVENALVDVDRWCHRIEGRR